MVSVSDDALRCVERGESVTFTGRAVRSDGTVRPIDGRASPIDAKSGKIKVRVAITRRVILVFNTTYRLAGHGRPARRRQYSIPAELDLLINPGAWLRCTGQPRAVLSIRPGGSRFAAGGIHSWTASPAMRRGASADISFVTS